MVFGCIFLTINVVPGDKIHGSEFSFQNFIFRRDGL